MVYVSHARTPEQLQAEVISDLNRRIAFLTGQHDAIARSAAEKARISTAIVALRDMLVFWQSLLIVRPQRKRETKSTLEIRSTMGPMPKQDVK